MIVLVTALPGCGAYKIPASIELRDTTVPLLDGSVSVDINREPGNGERWLADALYEQNLAARVIPHEEAGEADYSLDLKQSFSGKCFSEPMLTVMTLGIIPTTGCAERGYSGQLQSAKQKSTTEIKAEVEVRSIYGLVASFMLLSPGWVGERGMTKYEASLIIREIEAATASQ